MQSAYVSDKHYLICLRASLSPKQKAQKLREAYDDKYAPPPWALDFVGEPDWHELAQLVTIMTFDKRKEMVLRVATEREPTNIAMDSLYDKTKLKQNFGYEISGYRSIFTAYEQKELPPNFIMYARTPITLQEQWVTVDVVNAIGFAFDSEMQPDYQYFFNKHGVLSKDKKHELIEMLRNVFILTFLCGKTVVGKTQIVMCLLGGGAFANLFPGLAELYFESVFLPALKHAVKFCPFVTRLGLMGDLPEAMIEQMQEACGVPVESFGRVPKFVIDLEDRDKWLFMNAWDPHSVVGNGNAADFSLDGYWGRCSAMAYLCSLEVNNQIQYKQLPKPLSIPIIVKPYGVLGDKKRQDGEIVPFWQSTVIVDPAGLNFIQRNNTAGAGGASGAIYAKIGINTFADEVIYSIKNVTEAKWHTYRREYTVIHVVGPIYEQHKDAEFKTQLTIAYKNVLQQFLDYLQATPGKTITLNLLPISGGIFSSGISQLKMANWTYECYTAACRNLNRDDIQLINDNAVIHMCIYDEGDFKMYQKAFGQAP